MCLSIFSYFNQCDLEVRCFNRTTIGLHKLAHALGNIGKQAGKLQVRTHTSKSFSLRFCFDLSGLFPGRAAAHRRSGQ